MLEAIRSLVYRMGYRPSVSSIFFSQPLAFMNAYLKSIQQLKGPIITKSIQQIQPPITMSLDDETVWRQISEAVDGMETCAARPLPTSPLYQFMNFCVACGTPLAHLVVDVKECPHHHGKVYLAENNKGLPIITFEPTEEG